MKNRTIAALATPPGVSGLAVIRLSGPDAFTIADYFFKGKLILAGAPSHTIHYGKFIDGEKLVDTVTASVFVAPNSYTGENVVEISCHGGLLIANEIIKALTIAGAAPAEPGEFTRRAFLNGKLDLAQVEAVADIIHSSSLPGAQTAARQLAGAFTDRLSSVRLQLLDISALLELELDFADEDIEFVRKNDIISKIDAAISFCSSLASSFSDAQVLRSGYFVSLAGYPNSGKSTLFNALLNRKRAIVSEIPGTTRDYLEETLMLGGIAIRLVDTAGIRPTDHIVEIEGIRMGESLLEQSNMIIILNDVSISPDHSDRLYSKISERYPAARTIIVHNKIDLAEIDPDETKSETINISAKKNIGIEALKTLIENEALHSAERVKDVLVNQRQALLLGQAADALNNAVHSLMEGFDNAAVSIDIREAARKLGEITGETWNEDVLNHIFQRFCIGK